MILDIIGVDGNRNLVPLFYSHVPSESEEWWKWTLEEFLSAYFDTPILHNPALLAFMADLGGAFRAALKAVFPTSHVFSCVKHREVGGNVNRC